MFDALTAEAVLSLAIVCASGLAMAGTLIALRATRRVERPIDIEAAVQAAPYHRLHNIVSVRAG